MITSLQKKEIQTKKEHGDLHLDFITNIYIDIALKWF